MKEKTNKLFTIGGEALTAAAIDGLLRALEGVSGAPLPDPPVKEEEEEPKVPTFEDIVGGIRDALRGTDGEGDAADSARELADSLTADAEDRGAAATKKSDEVYALLSALGEKQRGDYADLAEQIKSGDYLSSPAAKAIFDSYMSAAGVASDNATADSAAGNGGNADSYGAANAHRQRLSYTDAAHKAALDLYERQADRLASLISSSGADLSDIYAEMQNNADSDADRAAKSVDDVSEMLRALLSSEDGQRELEYEAVGKLFDRYADLVMPEEEEVEVDETPHSPMLVDKEYDRLKGSGASTVDALIRLWKIYPDMREYIAEKYEKILKGDSLYIFKN